MAIRSFASLVAASAAFIAPAQVPSEVVSISAGADTNGDSVGSIQAAAVRGYAAGNAKLVWVKVVVPFFAGSPELNAVDDLLQVTEQEAYGLDRSKRAVYASDEEVAKALAEQKKAK